MNKLKTFFAMLLLLFSTTLYAVKGNVCLNAIEVDTAYTGDFGVGEYWFTALTTALPLTFYFYPDDEKAQAPDIYLDLTCTPGVYDDPIIADMVSTAGQYSLSFPMHEVPEKEYDDDGALRYRITYDRNYRDMLYNQGVTYPIPAYVRLVNYTHGQVYIVSKSVNSRCRGYVHTFEMDKPLIVEPVDSTNVYLWPIGDWINQKYTITWEGEGNLDLYNGTDCVLTPGRIRGHITFPEDYLFVDTKRTSDWINEIYQTEFYVKLVAQQAGVLHISTFDDTPRLLEMIIAGVYATIDEENKTISAILPAGTNVVDAITDAVLDGTIKYIAYNGETPSIDRRATKLTFGSVEYSLAGVVAATAAGSTDAALKCIVIDGDTLADFYASTLTYNDIQTANAAPIITVETSDENATYTITQASSVPGTATITVTAEAGNTLTYTLNFIEAKSRNTQLSSITIDGEPLVGFDPSVLRYSMYVQSLPVVSATAADPKATIEISQAVKVPDYALIYVTAEAGNTEAYRISFDFDPELKACQAGAIDMIKNSPAVITPTGNEVLRAPFGKGLDLDDSNWAGQRIAFMWSGDNDIIVYVGSSCLFDPAVKNNAFIDSVIISQPKGEERYIAYLTEKQTKEWGQRSIDGTLYLKVKTGKAGMLVAQDWTPNGNNNSTLIDINQEYYFPTGHTSDNLYKIYLPDWERKKVKFSWEGMEKMTMYGAAKWEFRLTASDNTMLTPDFPHQFSASDSWEWDEDGIDELILHTYMLGGSDFIYVRFITDGFAGTLETTQTGGEVTRSEYMEYESTTLSWQRVEDNILIRTTVPQQVNIFSLQGALITSQYLTPDAEIVLPRALYIVQGENETGKAW